MTQYEELLAAVTSNVDDDAPRLAFAAHIRDSEPDRARFIEQQIQEAKARRARRGYVHPSNDPLLRKHDGEWTRLIAKYARRWTFDRGFIAKIVMEPYLFLEYGDWLLLNYPIQMVELGKAESGAFPVAALADSPLLGRLEAVVIRGVVLTDAEIERLGTSSNLARLLHLDLDRQRVPVGIYDRLAASPDVRKLLTLSLEEGGPGQRYVDSGRDDMQGRAVHAWTDISPAGQVLEQKYGYLPWLHPEQNACEPLDAAWFVSQGILPVKAVGSPAG